MVNLQAFDVVYHACTHAEQCGGSPLTQLPSCMRGNWHAVCTTPCCQRLHLPEAVYQAASSVCAGRHTQQTPASESARR